MKALELKKSILQMAVEGKLIAQNTHDEKVEYLLERIKKEKEKLIKEGKIKKEKLTSEIYKKDGSYYERVFEGKTIVKDVCIDEELPFEIPSSWTWVRLRNVAEVLRGASPRPINQYITYDNNGINWIKISDTEKNGKYIYSTKEKITKEGAVKSRFVKSGDFLLTNSMSFGRPYILKIDGCIHDGWLVLSKYEIAYDIDFLFYLLSSNFVYFQFCINVSGAVVKNLSTDKVLNLILPIPPIEEQKRIVEKINKIIPFIDEYDILEQEITKLNKEFPNNIKKSILQYAIEGRLTERSRSDEFEPVEELLTKIKKEKEKLIKEGKIKKEKTTSEIYKKDGSYYERVFEGKTIVKDVCIDEELPFEIPSSWTWVNLCDIVNIYTGNSINEEEKKQKFTGLSSGYYYIATKDVSFNQEIDYNNGVRIPLSESKFRIAPKNSILLCIEGGSAGRKIAITNQDVCFGNKLCCFVPIEINVLFLYYYFQSPQFSLLFKDNINGIIGGVSINKLKLLKIPLPPIEEQKLIVERVQKLIETIAEIKV